MKKIVCLLVLVLLTSGCSAAQTNSGTNQMGKQYINGDFRDLSGAPIDFTGAEVKGFDLYYVMGWNFDAPGYRKLSQGDKIGELKISSLASNYYIQYSNGALPTVICNINEYYIEGTEELSGILVVDEDGIGFYPYQNNNANFLFVCERNEDSERNFTEQSLLDVGNEKKEMVQPIRFAIGGLEDSVFISRISELLTGTATTDETFLKNLTEPKYFKATAKFHNITIYPFSVGEGAGLEGTRAIGFVNNGDDIVIEGKV